MTDGLVSTPPVPWFVPRGPRRRVKPPCPCTRCRAEHRTDPGFCDEHQAFLDGFRDRFVASRQTKSRDGFRSRSPQRPTCCRLHCWGEREPGSRFCAACEAEGWAEGVGE